MSSSDSKVLLLRKYLGYKQFALGFIGLCVAGMYSAAVLSPVKRNIYSLLLEVLVVGQQADASTDRSAVVASLLEEAVFEPTSETVTVMADLSNFSSPLDYNLIEVRYGHRPVPRIFLEHLPRDLKTLSPVSARKARFLKAMLPLVLQVNETIMTDREWLLEINSQASIDDVSWQDRSRLQSLAKRYGFDKDWFDKTTLVKLLEQVDVVPPSLALSQAVEESGWGTSRFAQEGNSPFGQWTFNEARGLVPRGRSSDSKHAIARYNRLIDGVYAYVDNLNTHRAYKEFREARADMRRRGTGPEGLALAKTMTRYSERGQDYVRDLCLIISANNLAPLDHARLRGRQVAWLGLFGG